MCTGNRGKRRYHGRTFQWRFEVGKTRGCFVDDISSGLGVVGFGVIGVIVGLICGDGCSSLDGGGVLGCDLFYLGSLSDDLCVVLTVVLAVIEIRWAVEVARCFEAISSLAMVSANLAKDSSMVGGVDVGGIGESNESTIVIYRFEM
ncbi:hypothetical protein Tco_1137501, partial [Tanacetum coccineum]